MEKGVIVWWIFRHDEKGLANNGTICETIYYIAPKNQNQMQVDEREMTQLKVYRN